MPLRTPYHMLMRPMPLAPVTSEKAALVLIDLQGFTASRGEGLATEAVRRGVLGEFDEYYEQADAAVRNAARLLDAARAASIPVCHVRVAAGDDLSRQFRRSGLDRPPAGINRRPIAAGVGAR